MNQISQRSKYQPGLQWILAFIGFGLIIFSGKMGQFVFYEEYDIISLLILIVIGLLLMAPLILYILKERKRKS